VETAVLQQETDLLQFIEKLPARPELYCFGGGHVSYFVAKFAAEAGFRVTILDDRAQYANQKRFPEADKTKVIDFTQALVNLSLTEKDFVVILTRGHQYDEEVLEQAVQTPVRYLGMIGSKRKVQKTFERLIERGIPKERLEKIYAPLGLAIGAVTPQEIGISIVSELIKVKNSDPTAPAAHLASIKGRLKRPS
jgi:xanthine dehydrogenase accessory factor